MNQRARMVGTGLHWLFCERYNVSLSADWHYELSTNRNVKVVSINFVYHLLIYL